MNGLLQINEAPCKEATLNQVAKLLNIHRINIYSALGRVLESDATSSRFVFDLCKRKSNYGGLSHEVEEIVIRFWTEHTRVPPNKKDICQKRRGNFDFIEHLAHVFDDSQVHLLWYVV